MTKNTDNQSFDLYITPGVGPDTPPDEAARLTEQFFQEQVDKQNEFLKAALAPDSPFVKALQDMGEEVPTFEDWKFGKRFGK
jgi:hypothetical protein